MSIKRWILYNSQNGEFIEFEDYGSNEKNDINSRQLHCDQVLVIIKGMPNLRTQLIFFMWTSIM